MFEPQHRLSRAQAACPHEQWVDPPAQEHPITGEPVEVLPQLVSALQDLGAGKLICRRCAAVGFAHPALAREDRQRRVRDPAGYVLELVEAYRKLAVEKAHGLASGYPSPAAPQGVSWVLRKKELEAALAAVLEDAKGEKSSEG